MNIEAFRGELQNLVSGDLLVDEPMALHTTWKIGGPADLVLVTDQKEDLREAVRLAAKYSIPFYVIGNGSNVLIKDKGVRGLVIKMAGGTDSIINEGLLIKVFAGVKMPVIARWAANNGLSGLEFAVGIPASAGGAVVMNAGAHGSCMANVVREVNVLGNTGEERLLKGADIGFGYRKSRIKENGFLVTEVTFALCKGSVAEIKAKMNEFLELRRHLQPKGIPNAGSVFKNPPGTSAGRLIDEAGCKGLRCGGARVSTQHANFILNTGGATACDVLNLIERVKKKVYESCGIELEPEVQIIGE